MQVICHNPKSRKPYCVFGVADNNGGMADVEKMHYVDRDGVEKHGCHWTVNEVETATANKTFGKNVTKYDKFVAYNAFYADLCTTLEDAQILEAAYLFWFADKDWKTSGKIWDYMGINR